MGNMPVNIIDISVGVILLLSAILAYSRGFVHEMLSVAGWIGATFATIYAMPFLKPYARDYIPIEIAADITAGVSIFIISLVILSLLTRAISRRVQNSGLNALDRSLGFLFGLARGAILLCLVFIVANWIWPLDGKAADGKEIKEAEKIKQSAWILKSRTLPLIRQGSEKLTDLVPPEGINTSSKAAEDAKGRTKDLLDTVETLRKMTTPNPKSPDTKDIKGYGLKDRHSIDKAFESVR